MKEMLLVPYSKERPVQCFSCQEYDHTQSNCYNPVRCLKCSGSHRRDECPNPENLRCANCQEIHPASDRSCQAYIREIRKIRSQGNSKQAEKGPSQAKPAANPWISAANMPAEPREPAWTRTAKNSYSKDEVTTGEILPAIVSLLKSVITMIKTTQETGKFDADSA